MKRIGCAVLLTVLAGCSAARRPVAAAKGPQYGIAPDRSFIDIEPGWRLRVITPLLKSGGYRVRTEPEEVSSDSGSPSLNIQMRVDSEFLGYEQAYYSFETKGRIRLTSVEATIQGKTEPRQKPAATLFQWPRDARFVRLVFLTRASDADHDMAVLTARRYEDLDGWTAKLRTAPDETCRATRYCSWIPGGIAVRAESRDPQSGNWRPADGSQRPK
jgi:hypothetical protein